MKTRYGWKDGLKSRRQMYVKRHTVNFIVNRHIFCQIIGFRKRKLTHNGILDFTAYRSVTKKERNRRGQICHSNLVSFGINDRNAIDCPEKNTFRLLHREFWDPYHIRNDFTVQFHASPFFHPQQITDTPIIIVLNAEKSDTIRA